MTPSLASGIKGLPVAGNVDFFDTTVRSFQHQTQDFEFRIEMTEILKKV
jgi:hypothetical protein